MAEWTGQKRTLNSIPTQFDPPLDDTAVHSPRSPEAPGAVSSPQIPGMTPDDPDLPGRSRGTLPPLSSDRRPLTEYGTAQRILRMFSPAPGAELAAADWEQGPASREEVRKADPALTTPLRPLSGSGLGIGQATSAISAEAVAALGDPAEATLPAGEPATSPPAETAPPAHVGAAQVSGSTAEIPAGAVAGNGTTCPDGYPIKGNAQSKIFHPPTSRVYAQTVAELCFANIEAAQAAGFTSPRNL